MTLRIVDGDAHLLEGAEFIAELMEAHPDKVQFQSGGGISGATIEGKRFPNSTGKGCGVDAATSLTLKANNPFEPHGVIADADREGIEVMVCYPSLGIGATAFDDIDFADDFARRWNRWAARFCGRAPSAAYAPSASFPSPIRPARHAWWTRSRRLVWSA